MNKNIKKAVIFVVILCSMWLLFTRACVESNFLLSQDSRLPKWVKLPNGYTRQDVTASLFLYTGPFARFIMRGPAPDRKKLMDVLITANWHPATIEELKKCHNCDLSPQYYSASYKGITDLIEFRCKGPLFWIADKLNTAVSTTSSECPDIDYRLIGNPW
jgi:hypothetical protein